MVLVLSFEVALAVEAAFLAREEFLTSLAFLLIIMRDKTKSGTSCNRDSPACSVCPLRRFPVTGTEIY